MLNKNTFYSHHGESYILKVAVFTFKNDSYNRSSTLWYPWLHNHCRHPPLWASSYSQYFSFFSISYTSSRFMYSCIVCGHPPPSPQQFKRDPLVSSFCVHSGTFSWAWICPPNLYKKNISTNFPLLEGHSCPDSLKNLDRNHTRNDDALSPL